jgi:hypothetical protein
MSEGCFSVATSVFIKKMLVGALSQVGFYQEHVGWLTLAIISLSCGRSSEDLAPFGKHATSFSRGWMDGLSE